MRMQFKTVSVTRSGDYYQILFHDDLNTDDEPYFMIQAQFELPDNGVCYFESHHENLIGHYKAKSAFLSADTLRLSYGAAPCRDIEIKFRKVDNIFQELVSTLKEMIPEVMVESQ